MCRVDNKWPGYEVLCTCPQEEITDCPKCGRVAVNGFGQTCDCGENVRENKDIPEGYEKELYEVAEYLNG